MEEGIILTDNIPKNNTLSHAKTQLKRIKSNQTIYLNEPPEQKNKNKQKRGRRSLTEVFSQPGNQLDPSTEKRLTENLKKSYKTYNQETGIPDIDTIEKKAEKLLESTGHIPENLEALQNELNKMLSENENSEKIIKLLQVIISNQRPHATTLPPDFTKWKKYTKNKPEILVEINNNNNIQTTNNNVDPAQNNLSLQVVNYIENQLNVLKRSRKQLEDTKKYVTEFTDEIVTKYNQLYETQTQKKFLTQRKYVKPKILRKSGRGRKARITTKFDQMNTSEDIDVREVFENKIETSLFTIYDIPADMQTQKKSRNKNRKVKKETPTN